MTAALEFCPHHRGSPRLPIAHSLSAQQQGWHWALPRTETLQLPLEYRGKARCSWSFLQKSHNSQLVLSKSLLQVVSAGQGSHHHSPLLSESTACTCSQLSWCVLLKSRNFIFKAYAQWFIIYTFNITFIIFFHNLLKGSVTHFDQHSVLLGQEEFLVQELLTLTSLSILLSRAAQSWDVQFHRKGLNIWNLHFSPNDQMKSSVFPKTSTKQKS